MHRVRAALIRSNHQFTAPLWRKGRRSQFGAGGHSIRVRYPAGVQHGTYGREAKARRATPPADTEQLDERHAIPLDAELAIEALLKVDPDSPEVAGALLETAYPEDETNEG